MKYIVAQVSTEDGTEISLHIIERDSEADAYEFAEFYKDPETGKYRSGYTDDATNEVVFVDDGSAALVLQIDGPKNYAYYDEG